MDDIIREFIIESTENISRLDQELVQLEKAPKDKELLASVFRTIHTVKGTSGMLGFNAVERVAHLAENLLSQLRNGERELTSRLASLILESVDAIKQELVSIETNGQELGVSYSELEQRLKQACESKDEPVQPSEVPSPAAVSDDAAQAASTQKETGPVQGSASDSTIRVDVGLLDRLMNLVGELVLARNQILQYCSRLEQSGLIAPSQRLDLITTELQEGVMKTRMQPIGNIWNKFPRTVRDVAVACGKEVRIEMEGNETELDKTIIEAIKDPLTHLIRNAVDHGIETPQARKAVSKPPEGRLFLRAFHEGGQVIIEITDDGRGLDLHKLRNRAVQKELITADQAARLSERETTNLIFLPGFSTAEKVTNVSGRGVGMDVVKTKIEKIGGTVDVQSKVGQGTTVRMKIPLTLAIIPALIVTAAGDRYAIPQVSLLELVRLEGESAGKNIEMIHGTPVYRLRGKLLPLAYLDRELKLRSTNGVPQSRKKTKKEPGPDAVAEQQEVSNVNIVVLRADDRQFGLVVDEVNDTEEIVVKPLSKRLKSVNAFAGATIMGDGEVALILDVMGLAQRANVVTEVRERSLSEKEQLTADGVSQTQTNTVLLFQNGEAGRMAIDLSLVARLEEFSPNMIELSGEKEVVQYRGQIMPLLRISELVRGKAQKPLTSGQDSLHVVVYASDGRSVGLVVDRILDIVEEPFVVQRETSRAGILGSAVIQKRVTDVLDVPSLIASCTGGEPSKHTYGVQR